jgi:cell division topological specificity factor|uniref:septum-site determining protein n=1 Tax=Cryptomonas pyrenoidifera TaxID=233184 RepID=UPI0022A7A48B|nr:septum-site determining protein [Cryptomonas pyrenoidifera]UZS90575.1 septum-site determining protein [Cryptomonas pyrenoidifera]
MITEFFERLFVTNSRGSRNDVKRRLKLVLAHDRSTLNASTLEKMRKEILIVVSKYVELDTESLEFSIRTDSRMTALIANLPIRRILQSDDPL